MERTNRENYSKLHKSLLLAIISLLIAIVAMAAASFAWYIYNTEAHTTDLHMAAGSSISLKISNSYDGPYASSAILQSFVGTLNPVSTNSIRGGFQKVFGFTNGTDTQPSLVANLFKKAENSDFYTTSLYIKADQGKAGLYIGDIGFEDSNTTYPISTAIRIGFVIHKPGRNGAVVDEFVFAINTASNPAKEYNTQTGQEGYVLDCTKTDGSTVPFSPNTPANYCNYDSETGTVSLKTGSVKLCDLNGDDDPVCVDVYIWLEGCDQDCTNSLAATTLKNVALSFAGFTQASD